MKDASEKEERRLLREAAAADRTELERMYVDKGMKAFRFNNILVRCHEANFAMAEELQRYKKRYGVLRD